MAGSINKPKKPKSKRGTSRLRHKIIKKSAAKQRKDRKLAKKNPEWRSKLKKDPGIPNLFPLKGKLLQEVEERRMRKAQEDQRRKELAKAAKTGTDEVDDDEEEMEDVDSDDDDDEDEDMEDDEDIDESNPMAALLASARQAAAKYDKGQAGRNAGDDYEDDDDYDDYDDDDDDDEMNTNKISAGQASSRKTYDKVFRQVIDEADVVLYVLDARDPEGTRSREVERNIMAAAAANEGRRLILVLNKIDLVPPRVLRDWLVHLRRYFPTLPLRASASASSSAGVHAFDHRALTPANTAATLLRALKSFAASRDLKRAVSVGVVGYPNVGKSSVINALLGCVGGRGPRASKRAGHGAAGACPAGAEAGITTAIRRVKLDGRLTLLDSPGVIFPSSSAAESTDSEGGLVRLSNAAEAHARLVLLNAVPPRQVDDPIPAVNLLLRRLSSVTSSSSSSSSSADSPPDLLRKLTDLYDIPALLPGQGGDVAGDFLVHVARKRGRLGRGGVPNLHAAATAVITDWRDGRIQGWVEAPVLPVDTGDGGGVEKRRGGKKGGREEAAPDHKEIVTEWAAEFKLDGLWGDDGEGDGAAADDVVMEQ